MTAQVGWHAVRWAIAIAVALSFVNQCRKPWGWPGRLVLSLMNRQHASVTGWALEKVAPKGRFTMLDIGCGGGKTIARMAALAGADKIYGIDYSAASVDAARRTNAGWIEAGKVDVRQGSVSHLPFPDDTFDLVTAVETHYYWPDLPADLREIARVLKPGGSLAIVAETYRGRRFDAVFRPAMMLLRSNYLSVDEHRELLSGVGFVEVAVHEERSKGWICATGRKPAPGGAETMAHGRA